MIIEHVSEEYVETVKTDEFAIYIFKIDDKWSLFFTTDPTITDIDPETLEALCEEDDLGVFLHFPDYDSKGDALCGLGEALFDSNAEFYYVDTFDLSDEAVWFISLLTHKSMEQEAEQEPIDNVSEDTYLEY